jgi:hypothetical protein
MFERSQGLWIALAVATAACGPTEDEALPPVADETPAATATAALRGTVVDWNDQAVAGAEVALAINGREVGDRVTTDEDGAYTLDVAVDAIRAAQNARQEITVLVYSPRVDRLPYDTVEGDRVHLLPITLREFIDLGDLQDGAEVSLRTAYVPLQAKGYKITPELVANGGTLAWTVVDPGTGTDITVEVVIEPDSIKVDGDEPQDEITLTVLDAERAPMQIPGNGFGLMWTLQPRDIRFDPPARIRMTGERLPMLGLADVEVGTEFELFGATLDRGWAYQGNVAIAELSDMTVTVESTEGIIRRGAWGHVLSDPNSDAGALVTCHDRETGKKVACALFSRAYRFGHLLTDNGVSKTQRDYPNLTAATNNPFVDPAEAGPGVRGLYYTDLETVCAGCTNNGQPHSQMSTGIDLDGLTGPATIWAFQLCESERAERDIEVRDAMVWNRLNNGPYAFLALDRPEAVEDLQAQIDLWNEYVANAPDAPASASQDPRVRFGYLASLPTVATCNDGDYQAGW